MADPHSPLRLKRKHSREHGDRPEVDVEKMVREQSLRRAVVGAVVAAALLNVLWVGLSLGLDRFFPWFSVIQGFLIGRAVQHYGRGLDWRYPVIAAVVAAGAAFTGSFLSALNLTGREFGTGALPLVAEIGWYTLSTFATREFGVVGTVYALMGAAIAAFFAPRRLDRYQESALRKRREGGDA